MTENSFHLTPAEEQALLLMEPGSQPSNSQLRQLADDELLLEDCLNLQSIARTLAEDKKVDVEERLRLFHQQHRPQAAVVRPIRRWWLAAAAAVLLLIGLFVAYRQTGGQSEASGQQTVLLVAATQKQADITMQIGKDAPTVIKTPDSKAATQPQSSLTLNAKTLTTDKVTLMVPLGKTYRVLLADGTEVYLTPDSRLVFPSAFTGRQREVQLQGEAYFKVAKDKEHPFVVKTEQLTTTVLGTEFNISCHAGAPAAVTLISGSVRVSTESSDTVIQPGEQATLDNGQIQVAETDLDPYIFRMQGIFYFDNATLADIMREIGRWYNLSVEFHNREALNYRMRFMAEQNEGIGRVLDRLNGLEKVTVTQEGTKLVVK